MNFFNLAHIFIYICGAVGIISLILIYFWLIMKDVGTNRMKELAGFI